jgi:UDP-4-amino-4,6-dideoxy-N-acetyl-beta-L-altrosamine transaminase
VIPYGKQDINQSDIDSVVSVLKSEFLTQGHQISFFEKKVSDYCGSDYGVAVNSATSALHIACLALELGKGDCLWTTPNTFVASANCALYCGARIDFVDVDLKTYNMSVSNLREKLIKAEKRGVLPKIIIPIHFAGQSCDMKEIYLLSKKYGFKIIEDASHAIGGRYLNRPIGGCQYSDITVFSFHPVKIITTAEGGLATTNSDKLAEKMKLLRSHGVTRQQDLMAKKSEGDWFYQQVSLGFNYRMNELQAALGVSQMDRLDEFVCLRHKFKKNYDELLKELPVLTPYQNPDSYSSMHLYPIQVQENKNNLSRLEVFKALRRNNIGVNVHYIPVHMQPFYKKMGFKKNDYPNAESYYQNAISIPIFQGMTHSMQNKVVRVLKDTFY